jgi:energy-coupling factor transporter ATP-binding protein EcfA2
MSSTICPYPGLRPFNEEESIFFKGREQQVERLVKRLEEKKFLMVNGASGDGKSSLIYAGVIPYAKAGFFKAKYNNWIVADFRPERSPLKNLTASICKQLKIEDQSKNRKGIRLWF